MNKLTDFIVVLHNSSKRTKTMRISKCVSGNAACRVADIKENMRGGWNLFRATDWRPAT